LRVDGEALVNEVSLASIRVNVLLIEDSPLVLCFFGFSDVYPINLPYLKVASQIYEFAN